MIPDFPFKLLRLPLILLIISSYWTTNIQAQNHVFSYAGTGSPGFVNGDTSIASFDTPHGIAIDTAGNLYLCDGGNHVIRKIGTDGLVSTYAGTGVAGYLDTTAEQAQFNEPYNLCLDPSGNVYVSDFLNQRIRKISPSGMVTTVAGTGVAGYLDGPDSVAQFNYPRGICIDASGNLYIGDSWNHRIRKITPAGMVSTWAGGGNVIGVQSVGSYLDGSDTTARFYTPTEISIDSSNNIYVADAFNHRIRKINVNQMVSTVAGSGISGAGGGGFRNGPGIQALFKTPTACTVMRDGNIFVGDGSSHQVRKIDTSDFVSSFAGSGTPGFLDGPDSLARFNFPRGIVMDYTRNRMYIVDSNNDAIRFILLGGANSLQGDLKVLDFEVFPNPFSGHLSLRAAGIHGPAEIVIYNAIGQIVWTEKAQGGAETHLDLETLPAGIFVLEASVENHGQFRKLLVKK